MVQNDPVAIGTVERSSELRIVHVGDFDAGRRFGCCRHLPEVIWCGWSTAYPASRKFRKFYDVEKGKANETDIEDT